MLQGQCETEAARAARDAVGGSWSRSRRWPLEQLESLAVGRVLRAAAAQDGRCRSSVRRRLLGQCVLQAEAALPASAVGCGSSSRRLLRTLRATAARDSRCRSSVRRMLHGQCRTQAEAAEQLELLAVGMVLRAAAARGRRCRSSVRRRLLGQRGEQTEAVGPAAGVGCRGSSSRLLWTLRAGAA